MNKIAFAVVGVAIAMTALCVRAQGVPAGWAAKAPLPAPRFEVGVATLRGKLYVIGGNQAAASEGRAVPVVEEYDPATDTWRARAPMPRGLDHIGVAVLGDKIVSVGGFTSSVHSGAQDKVFEYDPAKDSWRELAPLSKARGSVAVAPLDGKIHAIGGRISNPASRVGDHDIYDPRSDTWTSGPPLPTPRSGLAFTLYKGLIVVLGGELPPNTFAENEAFDPKANAWRTLAPMPQGRHATGAAVIGEKLYIAGGSLQPGRGQLTDQVLAFTLP